jgi:glycine cleavage system H protein
LSPDDRKYTKDHEWIKTEDSANGLTLVGITEYAQAQLGDIVFFDLPEPGATVKQHGKMGEVESVKTVSDIISPVSGQVTETNSELIARPELTNEDPYGAGWLVRVSISDSPNLDDLLSAEEYESYISGLS